LRERVTIFVSTAYLDEAERFQRLALLHKGKFLALGSPEEVKGLYPGMILEVRCEKPRHAAEILRKEMPGETVSLYGERLHVGTREPDRAVPAMEKALSGAGIPYSAIRPIEPALEDVFVALISSDGGSES
jgi:ABC-2 type transport system ATP-binding protein